MSEFRIQSGETAPGPINVSPLMMFGRERLDQAMTDLAPQDAIFTVADRIEQMSQPFRPMTPGETTVLHTPTSVYRGADDSPRFMITSFKYDTEQAYRETEIRGANGQTLLAAVTNYRGEPLEANPHAIETFCIDRLYGAFIHREEVRNGQLIVSSMPAGWNDIKAVMDTLDNKKPLAPQEHITEAEAPKVELARQQLNRFKATLSAMPEFRHAVVESLTDRDFMEEIPTDVEARLIESFWEGTAEPASDEPGRDAKHSRLEINMGGHNIVVTYQKRAEYSETAGEDSKDPGIVIVEELDLTVENLPELGTSQEIAVNTAKPHPFQSNVSYSRRKRTVSGDNQLVNALVSEYNSIEEIIAKADEVHELLLLPPSDISKGLMQKMLAIELLGAELTDNEWQPDMTEEQVSRLESEVLDAQEALTGLSQPGIVYPGVDAPFEGPEAETSIKRPAIDRPETNSSESSAAEQLTESSKWQHRLQRLRRIIRRLPFMDDGNES